MTYYELIDRLSEELDLTKKETRQLMKDAVSEFISHLGDGTGFTIPDLGTFKIRKKDPQKVYSPYYKKHMLVPPKRIVEFSAGKHLKEQIKFNNPEE